MTDKTEAQPEALRLADRLDLYATGDEHQRDVEESAAELRRQHAEIQQLKAQLTAQTNRAAASEQQVTALTHRLDMANRLNTDARNQLAQLSARQAAPDGQWKCGNEYLPYHPDASHVDPAYRDGWNDCYRAAPPPPEREPLTQEQKDAVIQEWIMIRVQGATND